MSELSSTAPGYIYDFFQDTEDNALHLSVHGKDGEIVNMQFHVTDALKIFASLSRILPRMKNLVGDEFGEQAIKTIVADPNLGHQLSVHVKSHPIYVGNWLFCE